MVKLADFGVGRSLDMLPHGAAKTRLVGTPLYFSPEMCEVPLAPPAGSPPRPSGRTLRRGRAGGAASRRSAGLRVISCAQDKPYGFPNDVWCLGAASLHAYRCVRAAASRGAAHGLGHARDAEAWQLGVANGGWAVRGLIQRHTAHASWRRPDGDGFVSFARPCQACVLCRCAGCLAYEMAMLTPPYIAGSEPALMMCTPLLPQPASRPCLLALRSAVPV